MAFQLPWSLLNQSVTRRRPVQSETVDGGIIIDSFVDQVIQARVQEKHGPRGKGGEEVVHEGIATVRHFVFDMNYVVSPTDNTPTDVVQTDRLVIVDAGGNALNCRIADFHDAAGARHHIIGTAIWTSPTGD